eukprot:COSAG02_NODE_168_length_31711_cov_68.337973_35_plen_32_part_00
MKEKRGAWLLLMVMAVVVVVVLFSPVATLHY